MRRKPAFSRPYVRSSDSPTCYIETPPEVLMSRCKAGIPGGLLVFAFAAQGPEQGRSGIGCVRAQGAVRPGLSEEPARK